MKARDLPSVASQSVTNPQLVRIDEVREVAGRRQGMWGVVRLDGTELEAVVACPLIGVSRPYDGQEFELRGSVHGIRA
jgi:hypothetical protein